MKRLWPALMVLWGFALTFAPHFILPFGLYRTVTMAFTAPEPRWWTHPELYLGLALMALGLYLLVSERPGRKRAMLFAGLAGLVAVLQGAAPVSFSGWMFWIPGYERDYHAAVLGLHRGIGPLLVTLGLCVAATAAAGYAWYVRFPDGRPGPPGLGVIAGRNALRRPFRSFSVALVSMLATGMMFVGSYVLYTTIQSGRLAASRLGADIIVVPAGYEVSTKKVFLGGEPAEFVMDGQNLGRVLAVDGVERAAPQLYIRSLPYRGCCAVLDTLVVAVDPERDFTVMPWVEYRIGAGLEPGQVIVGRHVMFAPGQRMQFFDRMLLVVGTLDDTGLEFFDTSSFVSMEQAYRMAETFPAPREGGADIQQGSISTILVKLVPGRDPKEAAARIVAAVPGVGVIPVESLITPSRTLISDALAGMWPILALLCSLCFAIQLVVFFMISNERMREVGIFRALGAKRGQVFRMFTAEAALVVGPGCLAGAAGGWLLTLVYRELLAADALGHYKWLSLSQLGLLALACVAAGLVIGVGSALFPAYRLSSAEPYEAIRGGE